MPFRQHLVELRSRMLQASIGLAVGFFIAWSFHVELFELLSAPIRDAMADNGLFAIKALQITESISVYMRLSLVGGLFLASPWVFWQIWAFVAPGLLRSEKRLAVPILTASVLFFFAGAAFCYFVVLPFMTDFLIKMTIEADGLTLEPTLQSTTSYALWLLLAFGLVFELPVFMYFLTALELTTARSLLAFYRYWVVIAAIIGALLTPTPDPINQLLMSGPLVVLYGLGIAIAWVVELDRRSGRPLPVRGALALLSLLLVAGWAGARQVDATRRREPLADVPRDAVQLVGVHTPTLDKLQQLAAGDTGAQGLGALSLVPGLKLTVEGPQLYLVRLAEGVVLIVPMKGADAVPDQVATALRTSRLQHAGGPSTVFTLRGEPRRLRITAPQPDLLWVGHETAVAALAAVRAGDRPALKDDVHFAERLEELRASGPLWALTLAEAGVAGWLPGAALADRVQRASAWIDEDGGRVQLRLECRSDADARSVRDRLAVWLAELRDAQQQAPAGGADAERLDLVTRRLAAVAGLLARVGESAARALPDGSSEALTLLAAANDASRLSRELRGPAPARSAVPANALARLGSPPQVGEVMLRGATLTWRVEGQPATLLAALLAPSREAIDGSAAAAALQGGVQPPEAMAPESPQVEAGGNEGPEAAAAAAAAAAGAAAAAAAAAAPPAAMAAPPAEPGIGTPPEPGRLPQPEGAPPPAPFPGAAPTVAP